MRRGTDKRRLCRTACFFDTERLDKAQGAIVSQRYALRSNQESNEIGIRGRLRKSTTKPARPSGSSKKKKMERELESVDNKICGEKKKKMEKIKDL
jgi:hypothetical protein